MNLSEKLILTDCDGVLLDWVYSFDQWVKRHGYTKKVSGVYDLHITYGIEKAESKQLVKMFNESANIAHLPPLRDAIKYVKKLHEEKGFVFHCITSLSLDPFAARAREENIKRVFGETVFEKIICLDTGADKDEALLPYKDSGCYFIEDKIENAETGNNLGLQSLLMEHDHNCDYYNGDIPRAKNWKEIYEIIVG